MARGTKLTPYGEAFGLDESGYRRTPMATEDEFPPDDPLPFFLSDQAEEPEQPDIEKAWNRAVIASRILKTRILVVAAAAIVFAVLAGLLVGNPIVLLANATASLVGTSAPQSGSAQEFQAWAAKQDARAQTPTTVGAQALPPTARDAPTRDEIAAAFKAATQEQTEISHPPAEALFKQFQTWAAEQDARAQAGPVQKQQ
jgi:hypothetical protein